MNRRFTAKRLLLSLSFAMLGLAWTSTADAANLLIVPYDDPSVGKAVHAAMRTTGDHQIVLYSNPGARPKQGDLATRVQTLKAGYDCDFVIFTMTTLTSRKSMDVVVAAGNGDLVKQLRVSRQLFRDPDKVHAMARAIADAMDKFAATSKTSRSLVEVSSAYPGSSVPADAPTVGLP